ncbi:MAG: carbon starvation protein A [Odoribacteraceae bacterium]|jgi:carbon starvation protein CstA|nr:carbon starvation protein A [Odoribacteraceae bacterium]
MITFTLSIGLLIIAYFTHGKFTERFFGAEPRRETPVKRLADGVDYQELKPWRVFVIQFLNIAGLGPIFGAILGAAYGPLAYAWILLGCIFAGAVHDFFSGMLSLRHDGMSLPDIVGRYLGNNARRFMTLFTALLLIAVGVSFVNGPADLLGQLTGVGMSWWLYVIFAYYILATLLPINKIIGRIYPFMGAALIFMALGIGVYLVYGGITGELRLQELTLDSFRNMHDQPATNILFPMMFIVISCGAISGFHATQSPMMARCMGNERHGRPVFYGAMISEGIVAMIWATAAMTFFGGTGELNAAAAAGNTPAVIVNTICNTWLGRAGAVIAIIGVVVCPITSGDTAFRGMRLILADALKFNQKPLRNRLIISIPVFVAAYLLCRFDFSTLWKYVGISNQVLASVTLWTASAYLAGTGKPHWMTSLPATFLTVVCVTYFLIAPNKVGGLSLLPAIAYPVGIVAGVALLAFFLFKVNGMKARGKGCVN